MRTFALALALGTGVACGVAVALRFVDEPPGPTGAPVAAAPASRDDGFHGEEPIRPGARSTERPPFGMVPTAPVPAAPEGDLVDIVDRCPEGGSDNDDDDGCPEPDQRVVTW
jgi:hypothetical protein